MATDTEKTGTAYSAETTEAQPKSLFERCSGDGQNMPLTKPVVHDAPTPSYELVADPDDD